jgi:hypothetical protein
MGFRGGRGDYQPGYYQGDIFGGLGKIFHKSVGLAFSALGPAGEAIRLGLSARGALRHHGVALPVAGPGSELIAAGEKRFLPLGSHTGVNPKIPMIVPPGGGGMGGRVPRPSGKGFYTRRHLHALAMGLTRARPRMNPYNPQALRRASRRAHAFLRGVRKLVGYYTAKPHKGRPYIKARRKR